MRLLSVFDQVSLDGYFVDAQGDMSWAHKQDAEWMAFASSNASGDATLVFGRKTYEMMAGFWPTPMAMERAPAVADGMTRLPKVVFSRTLDRVTWQNTTLVKGDLTTEMRRMKEGQGSNMTILGSGSIVAQLSEAGLIDEFQIVVNPIVLGRGRSLFDSVSKRLNLNLKSTRAFGNGNVLLCYQPA